MDPKERARQDVIEYLDRISPRLQLASVDTTMISVRTFVLSARSMLSDLELRFLIEDYYRSHGILIPATTPATPSLMDSRIVQAVTSAVATVIHGVDITRGDGNINIAVSGLTAELKRGDSSISAGVSWGGTLSVQANRGNFYVSGELAQDHWEIKLSYPEETPVPNLSDLGDVFGEGEKAFRGIIRATQGISRVQDIPRATSTIGSYMKPLGDAVEAIQGIARAPRSGVSFGFSIGSPDPLPGDSRMQGGIQGKAVLTWRF